MTTIKQSVNQQFSDVAANYRTSKGHAAGHDLQHFTELIGQLDLPAVLDLGCGAGHATMAVAPVSASVVAYDLSDAMLAQVMLLAAERNTNNVTTRQGDVESLPFADNSFDAVVTRVSAHHWPNPLAALREARRVLRPHGKLLVQDVVAPESPGPDSFQQTFEILRDKSHVRDHSISQWIDMLRTANFQPRIVEEWGWPIVFDKWVTRMNTPAPNVAMIRTLFDEAPQEYKTIFKIDANHDFAFPAVLLEALPS